MSVPPRQLSTILCISGGGLWLVLLEATDFSVITVALGLLVALAIIR